jgi:hypothetical protein
MFEDMPQSAPTEGGSMPKPADDGTMGDAGSMPAGEEKPVEATPEA